MTNRKSTKKALLTSVLALLLCFSMLVGTTFAWFTDSVESGVNKIIAGNLDVDVVTADGKSIQDQKTLFDEIKLWEPGVVAYENLTVTNLGTLALKYGLAINFDNENEIVETGAKLSEVLKIAVVPDGVDTTKSREEIVAGISNWQKLSAWYESGMLYPTDNAENKPVSDTYGVVIWWQPSAEDNNWNVQNGKKTSDGQPLHIDLGISLTAWQLEYENDSFNNQYDANLVVHTVAEAQARINAGEDVVLAVCHEPDSVIEIPDDYEGTLTLNNVAIKAIKANGDANIVIDGVVTVKAADSSAITAKGELNISGSGKLTAIAADVEGAFGIGGMETTRITIKNVTIDYVSGGYAYGVGEDTKYYKDAPEGGAAIGSGHDGATITLENVTVNKAIGGSKAAGIGARYHTGVTVTIKDSTISYVEGGVSAAGIGGSRVSNGASESGTTITISNSTITAQGGAYGAGIGSGYDTHCQSNQPLCTINIENSTINATGGRYAAGVGTGYHNAALAGEIKNSTVNAASGEKFYKDTYTTAMDIGFGVVDPTREAKDNNSSITYNGTVIGIPEVVVVTAWEDLYVVNSDTTVTNQVAEEYVEICHNGGNLVMKNVTFKNGLTIYTTDVTNTGTITLENCTIYLNNGSGDPNHTGYTQFKEDYGVNLNLANGSKITFVFKNCTFTAADGHTYSSNSGYNVYIGGGYSADSVTFEGCTFEKSAKHGIGCSSEGSSAYYKLTVTGCNFKDWNNNAQNGAAIRGNLPSTTFVADITISGNTFGNNNNSTQDTVAIDSWNGNWN